MFLFIFEDGSLGKSEIFKDDDIAAVEDGLLDIVDMESGTLLNAKNEWVDIKEHT